MAHAHYMKPSTFLNLYIKNNRNSYVRKDLDFYDNEGFFDILESKSILSRKEIMNMSLRSQEGYLFTNIGLYPPQQIRKLIDKRSHYGLMYCPQCLAEDDILYWRKRWRYSFYNGCPKHHLFLTDRCWRCYKPIRLLKTQISANLAFCHNCKMDLRLSETLKVQNKYSLGIDAVRWFENGLRYGCFQIGEHKVWSVMFFHVCNHLRGLVDRKQLLVLPDFFMLDEYKDVCTKLERYNSRKGMLIYKGFLLNSMIYHIFQNFPNNFLSFIKFNNLTSREFTHGLKYLPFWYKDMLYTSLPKQNKIGREISSLEVLGAINYLKKHGKIVNQLEVSSIIGCHSTIHKEFRRIYKSLNSK